MICEIRISWFGWQNNMRDQKLLPEFQNYLLSRGLVPEKNIPFYALWASRFLSFGNRNENLSLDIRIEQFLKEMETKKKLADWQLRQAEEAVRMYTAQFLSGNNKTVSPNNAHDKNASAKDPAEMLAKMRELIRLKHYSYSTEHTYLDCGIMGRFYLSSSDCFLGLPMDRTCPAIVCFRLSVPINSLPPYTSFRSISPFIAFFSSNIPFTNHRYRCCRSPALRPRP